MAGNRRLLLVLLGLVLIVLMGLGGFYLYLTGGQQGPESQATSNEEIGFIHIRTIYTYGDDTPVLRPVGAGMDDNGDFYVALRDNATIVKFNNDGDYIMHWGTRGAQPGNMMSPMNVAADGLANHVYVADRARLRLICYDTQGQFLWETPLLSPLAPAIGPDGELFVATFGPLVKLSSEGEFIGQTGTRGLSHGQFDFPRSITVDNDGNIYVADTNNTRVQRVQMGNEITATVDWVVGEPPRFQDDPQVRFVAPSGIAIGEDDWAVVMDGFGHTFTLLDLETGEEVHEFGERRGPNDGMFNLPTSITHLGGNRFLITDTFSDRIQIVRIVLPADATILVRYPWIWWLLPLLLLPLIPFFGRKRFFATEETIERAVEDGNARLILAVASSLFVLPEVFERFKDVEEEDVVLGDYLQPLDVDDSDASLETDAEDGALSATEKLLAAAAERTLMRRILLARHRVICADAKQFDRFESEDAKRLSYDEIVEEYALQAGE